MNNYRETYVEINLKNIKNNVKNIIKKYRDYKYYFGVVKADSYGHYDNEVVKAIVDGGCNYLAVSSLEEALAIRKDLNDIPILCLGIINQDYLGLCVKNRITITIPNIEYINGIDTEVLKQLKVHIKVNTGMNRLGVKSKIEFNLLMDKLSKYGVEVEGIYTHIYDAVNKDSSYKQFKKFDEIIEGVDVPIIHVAQSETLTNYDKIAGVNGCRLGIIMYGFTEDKELKLKSTFKLVSKVIQINECHVGEAVGYNGNYITSEDEKIAVVPIGYADGLLRCNTGRMVYINDKPYPIVGNICMDMCMVRVDASVRVGDKVIILRDVKHIEEVAEYTKTIPYEVICSVGKRVPRKYSG